MKSQSYIIPQQLRRPSGGRLADYMRQWRDGMRLRFPDENWIDDVFDRRNRRLYAYCVADVKVTKVFYADYADIELRIVLAAILGYTVATPRYRLGEPHNLSIGGIMISLQWGRDREYRRDSEAGNPWPSKERAMMIAGMAGGWGAPLNKMAKIAECMFASGRYDACIGVSERALKNMEHGMWELGVRVYVQKVMAWSKESESDLR